MDNDRLLELAGVREAADPEAKERARAVANALRVAENALVDMEDEVIGMKHQDRDALMYALQQASNGLTQIKQILRRHVAF